MVHSAELWRCKRPGVIKDNVSRHLGCSACFRHRCHSVLRATLLVRPWPLILRGQGARHLHGECRVGISVLSLLALLCKPGQWSAEGVLMNPVSTTQAALVFISCSSNEEFKKIVSEARLLLLLELKITIERFVSCLYSTPTKLGTRQDGFGASGRLTRLHSGKEPVFQNWVVSGGCPPWFWAMGFLSGCLSPGVAEGRAFSNKPSVS